MRPFSAPQPKFRIEEVDAPLANPMAYGWNAYTDWQPMAEGGTCLLQTAVDKNLGRRVVVKTLHKEYQQNEVLKRRFVREARITAGIQHPNTTPVYEIGRDHHLQPYFTMKQVQGRSLRQVLDDIRGGDQKIITAFPLFRQLEVFTQVALAAAYGHACGVVHRDLKPANVQLGNFGEVVLLDWGLAKLIGDHDELLDSDNGEKRISVELTRAGSRLGTPLYMSPEQAKGDQNLDARSDVFSMGIILFEILAQEQLFKGDNAVTVRNEVLNKDIPPPSSLNTIYRIPPALDAICMKALKRDPAMRYASMVDLINDLDLYRAGGSISLPHQSGVLDRLRGIRRWWSRRNALPQRNPPSF